MEEHVSAWCPRCGEGIAHLYPFCHKHQTPTPLYVEINTVAQYLVGVPTYLELALRNAGETPIRLEDMELALGKEILPPGVYPAGVHHAIPPGESLIMDRRVDRSPAHVMPGVYQLSIRLAFSSGDQRFRMLGNMPVRFDSPGAKRIHAFDFATNELQCYAQDERPEGRWVRNLRFGESMESARQNYHVRKIKNDEGFCFIPVRMRYEYAMDDGEMLLDRGQFICPHCGGRLIEGGGFCHHCGNELEHPPDLTAPKGDEIVAYCPHCKPKKVGLRGRHRHCPVCGRKAHLYVEITEIPDYMIGVQVENRLRVYPVSDQGITLKDMAITLGQGPHAAPCDLDDGLEETVLHPNDQSVEFSFLVFPPHDSMSGKRRLHIDLSYAVGDEPYRLRGWHGVIVKPGDLDRAELTERYGPENVAVTDNGVVSISNYYKFPENPAPSKFDAYLTNHAEMTINDFTPVLLRMRAPEKPVTAPPVPDWPSADRGRLWFEAEGIVHNYVVFAKDAIELGRNRDLDVPFYEVEQYLAAQPQTEESTAKSSVSKLSRRQMRVEVADPGLRITHLSRATRAWIGEHKQLKTDGSALLGRNESILIHGFDNADPIIGLQFSAVAPRPRTLDAIREAARGVLDQMTPPPPASNPASYTHGGFRLNRIGSLTGEPLDEYPGYPGLEAYVLMPGWADIGSGPEACIVVPGIAPVHAWLFWFDGYFFIHPFSKHTAVRVNEDEVRHDQPWPIFPGCTIHLDEVAIRFDEPFFLYISGQG